MSSAVTFYVHTDILPVDITESILRFKATVRENKFHTPTVECLYNTTLHKISITSLKFQNKIVAVVNFITYF